MKKIAVIGAGPAGSYSAYLLAKEGYEVDIYEEHDVVGEPFQCTGILTSQLEKFVPIDPEWHVNQVHIARIACDKDYIDVRLNKHNEIIERVKFDQWLTKIAVEAGAKLHLKHRFLRNEGMKLFIKDVKSNKEMVREYDILIGADGPNSAVAKSNGLYADRKFWVGIQARAEYKNKNIVEVLPQVGTFGWVVPENDSIVRIGLVGDTKVKDVFDKLIADYKITKVIDYQGGLIPKYDRKIVTEKKVEKGTVYLIGDAALQVKATTAGGIIQCLIAAKALHEAITKGKSYEKLWRKSMGLDLWLHSVMRKIMDKFTDGDVKYCIHLFQQPRLKRLLEKFDREYPSQFVFKMLFLEPRLLYFAKFLF